MVDKRFFTVHRDSNGKTGSFRSTFADLVIVLIGETTSQNAKEISQHKLCQNTQEC
jgi:hypothetical protein